ncbi:hypothetical protein JKP88DRAFT_266261 [Tribonema minus]|uniref:UBA domain-containing protein n=1 Tax=Tribonema minus TaxID=303371 RepID=A0A835ZJB4_9STRA|nr:hypothetical protein JKP88DRAFT_266261 [Tribonema minus]
MRPLVRQRGALPPLLLLLLAENSLPFAPPTASWRPHTSCSSGGICCSSSTRWRRCTRLSAAGDNQSGLERARQAALAEDREWFLQFIGDPDSPDDAPAATATASTRPPRREQQQQQQRRRRRDTYWDDADPDEEQPVPASASVEEFTPAASAWQPGPETADDTGFVMERGEDFDNREAEEVGDDMLEDQMELTADETAQLLTLGFSEEEATSLTPDMVGIILERQVKRPSGRIPADWVSSRASALSRSGAGGGFERGDDDESDLDMSEELEVSDDFVESPYDGEWEEEDSSWQEQASNKAERIRTRRQLADASAYDDDDGGDDGADADDGEYDGSYGSYGMRGARSGGRAQTGGGEEEDDWLDERAEERRGRSEGGYGDYAEEDDWLEEGEGEGEGGRGGRGGRTAAGGPAWTGSRRCCARQARDSSGRQKPPSPSYDNDEDGYDNGYDDDNDDDDGLGIGESIATFIGDGWKAITESYAEVAERGRVEQEEWDRVRRAEAAAARAERERGGSGRQRARRAAGGTSTGTSTRPPPSMRERLYYDDDQAIADNVDGDDAEEASYDAYAQRRSEPPVKGVRRGEGEGEPRRRQMAQRGGGQGAPGGRRRWDVEDDDV